VLDLIHRGERVWHRGASLFVGRNQDSPAMLPLQAAKLFRLLSIFVLYLVPIRIT